MLGCFAAACGPSSVDPPVGSESSGDPDPTTTTVGSSTSIGASSTDGGGSSSADSSGEPGPVLPCAWVEGQHDAEIPSGMTPSNVTCDPDTSIATIQLAYDGVECTGPPSGDSLVIELPPELQVAGEHDLTELVARIYMSADLRPVAGQVDTGTLIITEVTPTGIVGWAHGAREGYDFLGSFEASYCP